MAEHQLPKLNTRVRFPSSAPRPTAAFGPVAEQSFAAGNPLILETPERSVVIAASGGGQVGCQAAGQIGESVALVRRGAGSQGAAPSLASHATQIWPRDIKDGQPRKADRLTDYRSSRKYLNGIRASEVERPTAPLGGRRGVIVRGGRLLALAAAAGPAAEDPSATGTAAAATARAAAEDPSAAGSAAVNADYAGLGHGHRLSPNP